MNRILEMETSARRLICLTVSSMVSNTSIVHNERILGKYTVHVQLPYFNDCIVFKRDMCGKFSFVIETKTPNSKFPLITLNYWRINLLIDYSSGNLAPSF